MVAAAEIVQVNLEERRAKDGKPGWRHGKVSELARDRGDIRAGPVSGRHREARQMPTGPAGVQTRRALSDPATAARVTPARCYRRQAGRYADAAPGCSRLAPWQLLLRLPSFVRSS